MGNSKEYTIMHIVRVMAPPIVLCISLLIVCVLVAYYFSPESSPPVVVAPTPTPSLVLPFTESYYFVIKVYDGTDEVARIDLDMNRVDTMNIDDLQSALIALLIMSGQFTVGTDETHEEFLLAVMPRLQEVYGDEPVRDNK